MWQSRGLAKPGPHQFCIPSMHLGASSLSSSYSIGCFSATPFPTRYAGSNNQRPSLGHTMTTNSPRKNDHHRTSCWIYSLPWTSQGSPPNCPSLSITKLPCIGLPRFHLGPFFIFLLSVICFERCLQSFKMRVLWFLLDGLDTILPSPFLQSSRGVRDAPVLKAQYTRAVSTVTHKNMP